MQNLVIRDSNGEFKFSDDYNNMNIAKISLQFIKKISPDLSLRYSDLLSLLFPVNKSCVVSEDITKLKDKICLRNQSTHFSVEYKDGTREQSDVYKPYREYICDKIYKMHHSEIACICEIEKFQKSVNGNNIAQIDLVSILFPCHDCILRVAKLCDSSNTPLRNSFFNIYKDKRLIKKIKQDLKELEKDPACRSMLHQLKMKLKDEHSNSEFTAFPNESMRILLTRSIKTSITGIKKQCFFDRDFSITYPDNVNVEEYSRWGQQEADKCVEHMRKKDVTDENCKIRFYQKWNEQVEKAFEEFKKDKMIDFFIVIFNKLTVESIKAQIDTFNVHRIEEV